MGNEKVKSIPYGLANYERLVQKNCYYVDKTMYLKAVEESGDYVFIIRPRRFGKSLFVSLMEAYYDVFYRERFDELFKGTFIHRQPTEERGAYLVLKFDFSGLHPAADKIETSFLHHIRTRALFFLRKYGNYLTKDLDYFKKTIEESRSPSDILATVNDLCRASRQQLYIIVDEYDNFANTILSTAGKNAYQSLTHGEGFFRSFFNVLKEGTSGMGAPIARLFLTGVSPITLDDVTSGFNIGENISLDFAFNRMLGFTETDIRQMIHYYQSTGLIGHDVEYLLEIFNRWYGNYLFSKYADETDRVYNADMILYFFKEYFKTQSIPDDPIDRNVRIDYRKLRHLIISDRDQARVPNGNFGKLREIIETGEASSRLVKGFPLEKLVDANHFVSLLFYFGLLTIESVQKDQIRFIIPNETVKRLYYDYIEEAYRETDIFDLDLNRYSELMSDLAYEGKWKPLLEFITGRMRESMSLRDLITGEKSIQAFLNVYLGLSNLYLIHTEKELNKGYADIVMEPFLERYEGIKYSYLLEIKYLKNKKPANGTIRRLKAEAAAQLERYSIDPKINKKMAKTTLVKLVLIFCGARLIDLAEIS